MSLQTRPKYTWTTIHFMPSMGGGVGVGIGLAQSSGGGTCTEKRFGKEHIEDGFAQKEIAILRHLGQHPYITKMHDHFVNETEKKAVVYVEHCDMGSLAAVHAKANMGNRVHERKIWQWFIQIMEALVYCHRGPDPSNESAARQWKKIYHLGVQPGNIFLTKAKANGEMRIVAKLGNFAHAQGELREFKEKAASRANLMADQMLGFDPPDQRLVGKSTDVWQLALTMVCVCGLQGAPRSRRHPYGAKWDKDRPAGQVYSSELSSVLKGFLNEDVNRRPGTFDSLKKLKQAYDRVKHKLPADNHRLEIYDPRYNHEPPKESDLPEAPRKRNGPPGRGPLGRRPPGREPSRREPPGFGPRRGFPGEDRFGSPRDFFGDEDDGPFFMNRFCDDLPDSPSFRGPPRGMGGFR
ncbi:kinase-like protein [Pyrenochaeta sp. DS3sAY3a]|nr:kinase-like protein [Pyrenochaeta sp. DS3sAY3a]